MICVFECVCVFLCFCANFLVGCWRLYINPALFKIVGLSGLYIVVFSGFIELCCSGFVWYSVFVYIYEVCVFIVVCTNQSSAISR